MAQVAAGGAIAAIGTVNPFVAFGVMAVAAIIDRQYVFPALFGDKTTKPKQWQELPQSTVTAGAPRVFALGQRVRVPGHVLWLATNKVDKTTGGNKSGKLTRREVFADVGIAFNDRLTNDILQFIVDGRGAYLKDRNLVTIATSDMTASVPVAGTLRLTMNTLDGESFEKKFCDGIVDDNNTRRFPDVVVLKGFGTGTGGINGQWLVTLAVDHSPSSPSYIELQPLDGQTPGVYIAGDIVTPASITRVDDSLRMWSASPGNAYGFAIDNGVTEVLSISLSPSYVCRPFDEVFQSGDVVDITGVAKSGGGSAITGTYTVTNVGSNNTTASIVLTRTSTSSYASVAMTFDARPNPTAIRFHTVQLYYPGLFASDPLWHQGTESESEDSVLLRHEGTGTVPRYHGVGWLSLDQWNITDFGNRIGNCEALLDVDGFLTHAEAIQIICSRAGLDDDHIDVSAASLDQCAGYYLMGSTPTTTALQPLLMAKQTVTQERDDVLVFSTIDNLDLVQIRNGADFSDMGAAAGGKGERKFASSALGHEELPTSIGVKHQDPTNLYAPGYQHFGLRNPTGVDWEREEELNCDTLVMTPQQARDLAATYMRRLWLNSDSYDLTLPASYSHLIENDLITWTDDSGNDYLARIVRVDRGANFLVRVKAVKEQLELGVRGSPVQALNGLTPDWIPPVTQVTAHVMDIPPIEDKDMFSTGVYAAAASQPGGVWAGAVVYMSTDGGTEYEEVGRLSEQTTIGETTDALADHAPSAVEGSATVTLDATNTVNVSLAYGSLASMTADQVKFSYLNWALIGDEIVGFEDVTLETDGTYTLSNLFRGLQGTGPAAATHAIGDRFVLLTGFHATGVFIPVESGHIGDTLKFKVVPTGSALADVTAVDLTFAGRTALPMPPGNVSVTLDGSNNATFVCDPWSRRHYAIGDAGPYQFDESFEEYVWTIYSSSSYATPVATLTDTSRDTGSPRIVTRGIEYTAAEQTADGLTPGATIYYDVRQVGDFGAGAVLRGSA